MEERPDFHGQVVVPHGLGLGIARAAGSGRAGGGRSFASLATV